MLASLLSIGLILATDGSTTITNTQKVMSAVNQANVIFDNSAHKTGGHRDLIVDRTVAMMITITQIRLMIPSWVYIQKRIGRWIVGCGGNMITCGCQ